MILHKIEKFLIKIECFFHKINVGRIIAYHCRGYVKTRIESWYCGNHIVYFEGMLCDFRKLKWEIKRKLYKERVYVINAKDDFLVIQRYENLKREKLLKKEVEENVD